MDSNIMSEAAWKLLKEAITTEFNGGERAQLENLPAALRRLSRRQQAIIRVWYPQRVRLGQDRGAVNRAAAKELATRVVVGESVINVSPEVVHQQHMNALRALADQNAQKVLQQPVPAAVV